jgi:hypothetical protein
MCAYINPKTQQKERYRVWGFYHELENAEKAVLADATGMFELGHYNWAMIEKVDPGIIPISLIHKYYRLKRSNQYGSEVIKVEKTPKWAKGICNFTMG